MMEIVTDVATYLNRLIARLAAKIPEDQLIEPREEADVPTIILLQETAPPEIRQLYTHQMRMCAYLEQIENEARQLYVENAEENLLNAKAAEHTTVELEIELIWQLLLIALRNSFPQHQHIMTLRLYKGWQIGYAREDEKFYRKDLFNPECAVT